MKNISKLTLVVLPLMLLIFGSFYWFQLRPANIRKSCVSSSYAASKNYADTLALIGGYDEVGRTIKQDEFYQNCLLKNGMKAERLYDD